MKKLRLLASHDKAVVEVLPDPTHSLSGGDNDTLIEIPEAHRRFSELGRVIAIGKGHYTRRGKWIPTTIGPGDVVQLPVRPDVATCMKDNASGKEYRVLREREILGVVE
jgi:co-chaperonin GroES (HSP10)